MNDETQAALTRFDFTSGLQRGSHLMLYPRSLVHRSDERNARPLAWGIALVVLALLLLAIAAPLGHVAHEAAQEMISSGQGVGRALYSLFHFIEVLAALLPAVALAAALGGAALGVLGWRGSTTLTLLLAGSERSYSVRGRDTLLLDFAELAAERLLASSR
ncbi:MAG: hypothetical protein E6H77_11890 [Betaproteobacteria bacterium]|nr:MAG: hypothetical protein E6H77_11890 [Betaproteobacteria bacterium]